MMNRNLLLSSAVAVAIGGFAFAQQRTQPDQQRDQPGAGATNSQSGSQSGSGSSAGGSSQTGGSSGSGSSVGTSGTPGRSDGPSLQGSSLQINQGDNTSGAMDQSGSRTLQGGGADQQIVQTLMMIRSDPSTAADKLFILHTAMMDQWEIEFARLAEQRAQSQEVKDLARQVMQDHQQSMQQLQQLAQQMNLQLPQGLPQGKQAVLSVYQALPVDQFETSYIIENKASHAKAVTSFADHRKTAKNEQLRNYVSQALPKLEQHAQHISQVAQARGVDSTFGIVSAVNSGSDRTGMHGQQGGMTGNRGSGTDRTGTATTDTPQ